MPLSINQQSLINQLEAAKLDSSRFTDLKCVNASATTRRGVLSLLFKGYDEVEGTHVALKFMDPDRMSEAYRLKAFEREPELIAQLTNNRRNLGLIRESHQM